MGEKALGNGKIDITSIPENTVYSFTKTSTGNIGAIENIKINLILTSGKLPQTQGIRKENIVDGLKVTINGGREENIEGQSYTKNPNYDILLDSSTGNLQIKKKRKGDKLTDKVKIVYLYKNIELGEFTLEITNKNSSSFEIIGDDIIDFGEIVQGENSRIQSKIIIKNLDSRKIVKVTLNDAKPPKMVMKKDASISFPVEGTVSLLKQGVEVPIEVDVTAKPKVDSPVGEYTGDLDLYIYIE